MKLRVAIEEIAVEVCKRHSHAQITELHILRALHSAIGSVGSKFTTKAIDKELDKIPVTRNATIGMSPLAAEVLNLIDVEDPIQIRDDLSDQIFNPKPPVSDGPEAPDSGSDRPPKPRDFEPDDEIFKAKPKPKSPRNGKTESLETVLAELNSLIGLAKAKDQVNAFIAVHAANIERKKKNLAPVSVGLHLVFTGSPGTGKTTVARLVGRLYKAIGILDSGEIVEVDRSDLIAGYVGQTALKTQAKIAEADGGVLFIDEAYSLSADSKSEYGFGDEAIATLVKAMEDKRGSFAVVVAGYSEDMDEFIKSNKGLKSRFQTFIDFEDYTSDELVDIFKLIASQADVICPPEVESEILDYIQAIKPTGDDGNGRFARNLFEKMFQNMTTRAMATGSMANAELTTFEIADVPKFERQGNSKESKMPFGFN
jgi:SpoVK/Ycf46/Vps4 family AAA+-type ATPase